VQKGTGMKLEISIVTGVGPTRRSVPRGDMGRCWYDELRPRT
jgi:hypothetical protein